MGYLHQNNIGDDETPVEAETIVARRAADGTNIFTGGSLALGGGATALADGGDQCALRGDFQVLCWRATATLPADIGL